MSTLGKHKPTNLPKTGWGKTGWWYCDTEWRIKVPGLPALLNRHHPPTLEASTFPTKDSRPSKHFTQFNTLPMYILNTIYMWYLSLVHHKT